MRLAVINTYAGSLLEASLQTTLEPVLSLESEGYGADVQRANWPELDVRSHVADWPEARAVGGMVVAAHPPCAPFARQGIGWAKPGMDSPKCQDTRRAVEYALSGGCHTMLLESVPRALEGAAEFHEDAARRHGYGLYRLLVNSRDFGIPQDRPRFWAVFTKVTPFLVHFQPHRVPVSKFLHPGGFVFDRDARMLRNLDANLRRLGLDPAAVLSTPGKVDDVVGKMPGWTKYTAALQLGQAGRFQTSRPRVVPLGGLVPTLMKESWWLVDGRNVTREEYLAFSGFRPSYRLFPDSKAREYLSRGVTPPVAAWLMRQASGDWSHGREVRPGSVVSLEGPSWKIRRN